MYVRERMSSAVVAFLEMMEKNALIFPVSFRILRAFFLLLSSEFEIKECGGWLKEGGIR